MKIDPRTEVSVLAVVKEEGEADRQLILDRLKAQFSIELSQSDLMRYLHKLHGKRILVMKTREGVEVWRIASVPPWYISAQMDLLGRTTNSDIKTELDLLDKRLKSEGQTYIEPTRKWGNHHTIRVTFEAIDPILGGRTNDEESTLYLPRVGDRIQIPSSMFKAMIRDNIALIEVSGLQEHVGLSPGEILGEVKPGWMTLPVKDVGLIKYEYLPTGTKFKSIIRVPLRGTSKIKSVQDFVKFLELVAEAPIRGFGANPYSNGGRIKPVEVEELS